MADVQYGFVNLQNLFDQRVDEVEPEAISTAITTTLDEHNRQINAFNSLFCSDTTEHTQSYKSATAIRLQSLDEQGRSTPFHIAGKYSIAFPLKDAGAAIAQTYKSGVKMTVGELNDLVATMRTGDIRWNRDQILAALYANADWTFSDDAYGDLTIKGLANGDSVTYQIKAGNDSGATDNHYLAQADSIDDSHNPFPNLANELLEHPENGGEVIALVPQGLMSSVAGLEGFMRASDPNIAYGSGTDRLIGSLDAPVPGVVKGYIDGENVWIVQWDNLPANYIIAVATQGERPLKRRQEPEPELQGFGPRGNRNDWPYFEQQWTRYAGYGAWNRVGAAVLRVGNASYAIPSNYSQNMP